MPEGLPSVSPPAGPDQSKIESRESKVRRASAYRLLLALAAAVFVADQLTKMWIASRMPLGTYTGWNPIPSGPLKGRERSLAAGYVPFARTKAERLAAGDPRLSIEERYASPFAYYAAAAAQAQDLVKQRLLLPDDALRLLKQLMTDLETGGAFKK